MAKKKPSAQELKSAAGQTIAAPVLDYGPPKTKRYNPPIALIGCGGISETHLRARINQGLHVVALCDLIPERAEHRRKEFFPEAQVYTDYRELLKRDDVEVVDIATHPQDREYLIPAALNARKHVLSQKPFVLDLDKGKKFAELADKNGVKLAVNQNGRWAPYFAYMRQAVNKGLIGEVFAAHLACHWDHEWIAKTHFNRVHHILLYDFAIHWFDMAACFMGNRKPLRVSASLQYAPGQVSTPPMLGQAIIEFEGGQASLVFDGTTRYAKEEINYIAGTGGTLKAAGPVCAIKSVTIATKKGVGVADVSNGSWFPTGFEGSMGELLQAIEQKREPTNNPLDNLRGLAMCFAAVASAESGKTVDVGAAKRVPIERCSVAAAKPEKAGPKKSGKGKAA